jgi:hypothetical protein
MGQPGQSVLLGGDRYHRVEAEEQEIGEVVARETFVREVRVDATQPPQSPLAGPQSSPIRQFERTRPADHHVRDTAPPIHENADLAANLTTQLREVTSKFVGEEGIRVDSAAKEPLELLVLAGFEALGIAVDLDGGLLAVFGIRVGY